MAVIKARRVPSNTGLVFEFVLRIAFQELETDELITIGIVPDIVAQFRWKLKYR